MKRTFKIMRVESVIGLAGVAACVAAALVSGTFSFSYWSTAWAELAVVATVCGVILYKAGRAGRLLEPLPIVAFVTLISFCLRPAQLLLQRSSLLDYEAPSSAVGSLLGLGNQEITLYVTTKLVEPLDQAFAQVLTAVLLFVVFTVIGYELPIARRIAARVAPAAAWSRRLDMRRVVALFIAVGFVGQALVYRAAGGVGAAVSNILTQSNFGAGFRVFAVANFAVVALLIWLAWHPPTTPRGRAAFIVLLLEVVGFYITLGSRALALYPVLMLVIVFHYRVRPVTFKVLVGCFVAVMIASSAYLAVRQASYDQPIGQAVGSAASYLTNPSGVSNDNSAFDNLFEARTFIGSSVGFRNGRSLISALEQFVPRPLLPKKPDPGDIWFRKVLWGDEFQAGRPYTLIGEFWVDFGTIGIIVGSLGFGWLCRILMGCVPRGTRPDPLAATVLSVALVVLYVLMVGVYSIAFSFVAQYFGALAIALFFSRRLPSAMFGLQARFL